MITGRRNYAAACLLAVLDCDRSQYAMFALPEPPQALRMGSADGRRVGFLCPFRYYASQRFR